MSEAHRPPVEWPTVLLGAAIYTGWAVLTLAHSYVPEPAVLVFGGWFLAWHGSFQHEAVHGHPTRSQHLNRLLAGAPLSLWLPFTLYERVHLAHHGAQELTDPFEDPESFYVAPERWRSINLVARAWLAAESTLVGRMVLGPWRVVSSFGFSELRRALAEPAKVWRDWAPHLFGVGVVGYWVICVCEIHPVVYLGLYVYPGIALTLLRSFIEHRAHADTEQRSAIVEAEAPFALLFLNNNLHVLHHAEPARPWFELPARYRALKGKLLERNGHYFFNGYAEVARRFGLRSKGAPVHPGLRP